MIELYEKDIRIIQNDDMPNSFEINYKDFGVSYHLGYDDVIDFEFYFSNTKEYKVFKTKNVSLSPNIIIELLSKLKPSLAKELNIIDDINIYGEKQLTKKDKEIIRYIYVILFVYQVNKLIESNMYNLLRPDILEFYLHLISYEEISYVLKDMYIEESLDTFDSML